MSEYLAPGVYIEEIDIGSRPIEGVSTSTAGFLGLTERGPVKPQLITSFSEYQRIFGGYLENSYLTYGVEGFFVNGGSRCFVGRIASKEAKTAHWELVDADDKKKVIVVKAIGPGKWGNCLEVKVNDASLDKSGSKGLFQLVIYYWKNGIRDSDPKKANITETYDNLSTDPISSDYYEKRVNDISTLIELKHLADGVPAKSVDNKETLLIEGTDGLLAASLILKKFTGVIKVEAKEGGAAGKAIEIEVTDAKDTTLTDAFDLTVKKDSYQKVYENVITVDTINSDSTSIVTLTRLAIGRPDNFKGNLMEGMPNGSAASLILKKSTEVLKVEAKEGGAAGNDILIEVTNAKDTTLTDAFNLTVKSVNMEKPYQKTYENLTIATISDVKDDLVTLEKLPDEGRPDNITNQNLTGGSDDYTVVDFEGSREGSRTDEDGNPIDLTGLAGFEEIDEISIICVPDENRYPGLNSSIVTHCEDMTDRFAILQADISAGPISDLWPSLLDRKCAAFYYPWISVLDPVLNTYKLVPPGGHVAGVYSRTDQERGVHKAPANEVVRGVNSLQLNITKEDQKSLNPRGVNCIRSFPGRGILIWGARTTSSDPKWKYVNVKRLFLYLEESIEDGTQWVVFEPNNEKLWAKVRQTVEEFLTRVWRDGALMGTTRDEAFFVRCDRTTMTQDDINNGRLIILVGVAPVKPAEFVIFRIAQVAKGSEIAEA